MDLIVWTLEKKIDLLKKKGKKKRREMKFMTLGRGGKEVSRKLLP